MHQAKLAVLMALAAPSFVAAQGLFWLVDFDDQFIGEVATLDPVHAWVAIDAPNVEPVFVQVGANGFDPGSPITLYYESASCMGTPFIETTANTPAHRTGFFLTTGFLLATKRTGIVGISAQSQMGGDLQLSGSVPFEEKEIRQISLPALFGMGNGERGMGIEKVNHHGTWIQGLVERKNPPRGRGEDQPFHPRASLRNRRIRGNPRL